MIKFIQLAVACPKCLLPLVRFAVGHLPIPTLEIKSGKLTGAMKSVDKVVKTWQMVLILDGDGI